MSRRNPLIFVLLIAATVALGLASRRFAALLPWWMAKNAGDVLYAVMAYWLAALCFPRLTPVRTAVVTLGFCFAIEFLKFSNMSWLVAARHNQGGALVFGHGFHVSNLACYGLGVALALGFEMALQRRQPRN